MRITEAITIVIYGFVGVISLIMAFKNLFSKKYLLFHEKAADKAWEELDTRLQYVISALMMISGLGFLMTGLLLLIFPVVNHFMHNEFLRYSIPVVSLIFCTGLFLVNYNLHTQTGSFTPWKGSLFAMIAILAGIILSVWHWISFNSGSILFFSRNVGSVESKSLKKDTIMGMLIRT